MLVQEPFVFTVKHAGRGGTLACRCEAGEILLTIEMHARGDFSVWLRGARLTTSAGRARRLAARERAHVANRLRAWLDATNRTEWVVEV